MVDWVKETVHHFTDQLKILGVERGISFIRRQLPCVLENHGANVHERVKEIMREKVREARIAEAKRLERME